MHPRPLRCFLPGMEVFLASCFFESLTNRPGRWHTHPCYELICVERESGAEFVIVPPLRRHFSVDAPPSSVRSLLFSFLPGGGEGVCSVLKELREETVICDHFDGASRIRSVQALVNDSSVGAEEQIAAELRLLFIGLARAIAPKEARVARRVGTPDELRLAHLEDYFNIRLKDANCSKQQLADELGVCERQLTRILKDTYNSNFSAILLQSRMTLAEAMRAHGAQTIAEIAEAVGYTSVRSLRRAYRGYYGYDFEDLTKRDVTNEK